jgi:hypothetical protein
MHTQVPQVNETRAIQQGEISSAIVVLSSSLLVLYANRGGLAVLRELKDSKEASLQIPASVLAYLADGILKDIDVRRMLRAFAPFSITCSIQGPTRILYCRAFGLPSRDEIDRSRIVLLFSDKPPRVIKPEGRNFLQADRIIPSSQVPQSVTVLSSGHPEIVAAVDR